jgi:hypothetical protein
MRREDPNREYLLIVADAVGGTRALACCSI